MVTNPYPFSMYACENRVLLAGPSLGAARELSVAMRRAPRAIESQDAYGLPVRAL